MYYEMKDKHNMKINTLSETKHISITVLNLKVYTTKKGGVFQCNCFKTIKK